MRALGPHPDRLLLRQRLAVGGPGTPNPAGDAGLVIIFTFTADAAASTCTSAEANDSVLAFTGPNDGGFGAGDGFGATLGQ